MKPMHQLFRPLWTAVWDFRGAQSESYWSWSAGNRLCTALSLETHKDQRFLMLALTEWNEECAGWVITSSSACTAHGASALYSSHQTVLFTQDKHNLNFCWMYTNLQVAFRILKGRHSSRSWQTCCILQLFLVFGREVTLVHPALESSITFNSAWVNVKRLEYFLLYPLQANTQCLHWFCRSLLKHHHWKVCCESLTSSVNSV